jgi:hypothetical protein
MKIEVCCHCDNYDPATGECDRYKKPIKKVGCCGVYARKSFNKPFSGKGMAAVIEYRKGHESPLHLGKPC